MTGYIHYGWQLSYFSGKSRSYLEYKGVSFQDIAPNLKALTKTIPDATGARVMPAIQLPDGHWLQDTSLIIDYFEEQYPSRPVVPTDPLMKIASRLFEAWADEWWIPVAMHMRWTYPENYALFEREAGDALLPWFPRFVKNKAVAKAAKRLQGFCPLVGVRPEQLAMMNDWAHQMLASLDEHFSVFSYLLGVHPTLMDFALMGPLYGHLGRDPWPKREVIAKYPHVRSWIDRMANLKQGGFEEDAPENETAFAALEPVFKAIFREFMPLMEGVAEQVQDLKATTEPGVKLPRTLKDVTVPMGKHRFSRNAMPFSLWMIQRVKDDYDALSAKERAVVNDWAVKLGGKPFSGLNFPRLEKQGVCVAFA